MLQLVPAVFRLFYDVIMPRPLVEGVQKFLRTLVKRFSTIPNPSPKSFDDNTGQCEGLCPEILLQVIGLFAFLVILAFIVSIVIFCPHRYFITMSENDRNPIPEQGMSTRSLNTPEWQAFISRPDQQQTPSEVAQPGDIRENTNGSLDVVHATGILPVQSWDNDAAPPQDFYTPPGPFHEADHQRTQRLVQACKNADRSFR